MESKSSRHLIDPDLLAFLSAVPNVVFGHDTLPAIRAMRLPEVPEDPDVVAQVRSEKRSIPGPLGAPDVGLIFYRPKDAAGLLPCIFHIHGGGYITMTATDFAAVNRALVTELGCVIASVEYRLAPEVIFPGAVHDCYAALSWLFDNSEEVGVDCGRIGVKGESAGGGLAASLALLARDRGEYQLAFQHLIYPMIDDRTGVTSNPSVYAGEFIWTRRDNAFGWQALLGRTPGSDDVSIYAAAARADALQGLPQTFIATGALDLFAEEDIGYATRLLRAGVPVELHVYPGAFHSFDLDPVAGVAVRARRDSADALKRALR